jgi:hypothetical protein
MSFKPIVAGAKPLASDADQYRLAMTGQADVGQVTFAKAQTTPAAPTVAINTTSGNLNGSYHYKIVLITGFQESDGTYWVNGFAPSADSASVSPANKQVNLSSIAVGTAVTIGRLIYRTDSGGATGTEKFCGVIWDNVTTIYTDNLPDSSLGTNMPTAATSVTVTNMTLGSPNISVSSTSGFQIGGVVTGNGVPLGTTILSVTNSTNFVMSQDATLAETSGNISVYPLNGVAYGTAIPANVPTTNTTGSYLISAPNATSDVLITSTSATNVLAYMPTAAGNFEILSYIRVVTATTIVSITITYTDGGGAQTLIVLPSQALLVGSNMLLPMFINSAANQQITITVTVGTTNQVYVSASIVGV